MTHRNYGVEPHPYWCRAALRNVAVTTRNAEAQRRPKKRFLGLAFGVFAVGLGLFVVAVFVAGVVT